MNLIVDARAIVLTDDEPTKKPGSVVPDPGISWRFQMAVDLAFSNGC
jgi:hypothetical protein